MERNLSSAEAGRLDNTLERDVDVGHCMKRFSVVFFLGLLMFAFANVVSLAIRSDDENGGAPPNWLPKDRFGFPIVFLERGGVNPSDEHVTYFSRPAMWADLAATLVVSSALASGWAGLRRRQSHVSTLSI